MNLCFDKDSSDFFRTSQLARLKKMKQECQETEHILDRAITYFSCFSSEDPVDSMIAKCNFAYAKTASCADRILSLSYQNTYLHPVTEEETAVKKYVDGYLKKELGYRCIVKENSINLRLPMLPARAERLVNRTNIRDYCTSLGRPVEMILRTELFTAEHRNYDLGQYLFHTIHFIFLYGYSSRYIPDSDNHDTKNVQDSICRALARGDSADTCQIILSTEISRRLPEFTYIQITSRKACTTDPSIALSVWNPE